MEDDESDGWADHARRFDFALARNTLMFSRTSIVRTWTACLAGLIAASFIQTANAQPDAEKPADPKAKVQPKPAPPAKPADGKTPAAKPKQPAKPAADKPKDDKPQETPAPAVVQPLDSPLSPFSNLQLPAGRRPFLARLSRTPDLFGDFNTLSVAQISRSFMSSSDPVVSVPGGGAVRRYKNEQARALPTDRVFAFFNHFHNAVDISGFGGNSSDDINQFTFGAEQTFDNGNWSVEIRLPVATETDLANDNSRVQTDGLGNLVVTLKKLLYADSQAAVAMGLAVTAPTGDDVDINFSGFLPVRIENEAVHLLPYLAVQVAPDDNWFFHAFAQVDVAANGDGIRVGTNTGRLVEQTLMFLDVAAGYWWMRTDTPDSTGLTGLASVLELHYSTALNDAHIAEVGILSIGNLDNRIDVVNLTIGLHSEWQGDTSVRLATVVPLRRSRENRFFDSEVQLAVIKRL